MKFVDEIKVEATAGKGGDGAATFRREKFVPLGGPSGGDGGRGGDVILEATDGMNTLSHLRYQRFLRAKNGVPGGRNKMHGSCGQACLVKVPVGTLIFDDATDELLGELMEASQRLVVCKGGRGGRGNVHFATPTNRAPHIAERGRRGQEKTLRLELKLLADVGLLGFPSVGKSTFVSVVSNARPKIADYPFTTLAPNLGVVEHRENASFVIADVPGLIVGASDGKGLGHDFLRHLDRTRIIVHLIEVTHQLEDVPSDRDPIVDFEALNNELLKFSEDLAKKKQIVVLNKCDEPYVEAERERLQAYFEGLGYPFHAISCQTRFGIKDLLNTLTQTLQAKPEDDEQED